MSERQMLLQELGKISFAAWEITLFLDTHPFHSEALEYRNHYEKTARALRMEYEQKYGPLTSAASRSSHCWDCPGNMKRRFKDLCGSMKNDYSIP